MLPGSSILSCCVTWLSFAGVKMPSLFSPLAPANCKSKAQTVFHPHGMTKSTSHELGEHISKHVLSLFPFPAHSSCFETTSAFAWLLRNPKFCWVFHSFPSNYFYVRLSGWNGSLSNPTVTSTSTEMSVEKLGKKRGGKNKGMGQPLQMSDLAFTTTSSKATTTVSIKSC